MKRKRDPKAKAPAPPPRPKQNKRPKAEPTPSIPRELVGKMLWVLKRDYDRQLFELENLVSFLKRTNGDLKQELWELRDRGYGGHCNSAEMCSECGDCLLCCDAENLIPYILETTDEGYYVCSDCS